MVTPAFLNPGDTIAIVSTARKISKDEIKPALELIHNWELNGVIGTTIGAEEHQFAGSDEIRTMDLQHMLDDPKIKAIWCARGGYGTVRIIDRLDFSEFKKKPKWIIGYSDVTVLHSHIHRLGIETIHAQMPLEFDKKSKQTSESLRKLLFGELHEIEIRQENDLNRTGNASGMLVGGNLSILYSLCGSESSITTNGKILFIEDLDEYLYHIDRMFYNLKRNSMLNDLAGLIVGGMSQMKDNTIPFGKQAEEIILEAVSEYDYPVCFHFPAGHIHDNRAMILGRKVNFMVDHDVVKLEYIL
jgi:muramoyltetrapeptide carboxypeptidase